jgi:hypothetical protein
MPFDPNTFASAMPRRDDMQSALELLAPEAAQRFSAGVYRDLFGLTPTKVAVVSPETCARAYVQHADVLEAIAAEVKHIHGWLLPRKAKTDFAIRLADATGKSAAENMWLIAPQYEKLLCERVGANAFPAEPEAFTDGEDISYLGAVCDMAQGYHVESYLISTSSRDEFGRRVLDEVLSLEGIAVGAEVDTYLAAIAEWTGVENDYLLGIELARNSVLEDDIQAYAEAGLTREYAAIMYTAAPFDYLD